MVVSGGWYLRTCYRYCVPWYPSSIRSRGKPSAEWWRALAQVPRGKDDGLVGYPWSLRLHGLSLRACRFIAIPCVETGQQKRNAYSKRIRGTVRCLRLGSSLDNYASLLTLSRLHTAATTDVQRAAYVAAANYASAVLESHTEGFYSIVDLSVAILIIGFVMLQGKGIFNKTTAYLGVGAGIFGIVSIWRFFVTIIINALLVTAWVLFAGYRLFRLGLHGQSSGSV